MHQVILYPDGACNNTSNGILATFRLEKLNTTHMNKLYIFTLLLISSLISINTFSSNTEEIGNTTDANLVGHVISQEEHIAFATVAILGTSIGTVTDETGHYQLVNLPEGEHTIIVSMVGYKTQQKIINLIKGKTKELKFDLEKDVLNIDEVVVSADRTAQKRTEAPVIVNTISTRIFNSSQSLTLGDGLNFSPGLRMENNCQNCGFTQVRMNGMEGSYSQILINSRPIFSGLAGVYGLELIPSTIIEKVEVVRGGGSALYGSNAIAGTINIILKEPKRNTYEVGADYSTIGLGTNGNTASDYSVNFNTTLVSDDLKAGVSLYGFTRSRTDYDANNDSFSELAPLKNLTFGGRAYHRVGYRGKLSVDFFAINEERAGGNKFDYPNHQRDISEAVEHDLKVGGLTYEHYFRSNDLLTVYGSGQFLDRDSYYGAQFSLSDYGNSKDNTYNVGAQYKANFANSSLVSGIENTSSFLVDTKIGAPIFGTNEDGDIIITDNEVNTIIADQSSVISGIFSQYEIKINKLKIAAGARFDNYKISDYAHNITPKSGNVISPRLSFMYDATKDLQARISYSKGFRAPQIFDEDLHIESSGAYRVEHANDPNLKPETSNSYMASLDFNRMLGTIYTGFLAEGFYTQLVDAFVTNDDWADGTDASQKILHRTRVNSDGNANVKGLNLELRLKPVNAEFEVSSGFTMQSSRYNVAQVDFNEKKFFRTPDYYGFLALDWDFIDGLCFSTTANYTGKMLVPYYGTESSLDENGDPLGELRTSNEFIDLSTKLSYTIKINGSAVQFAAGVKNIFNAYQSDFDYGVNRDPGYMYGPGAPRTIYFGIKFGNVLE